MKKSTVLVWVDSGLFLVLLLTIMSALIEIFIPWFVHVFFGLLMTAGVFLHLGLNWDWITAVFRNYGKVSSQVKTSLFLNLGMFLAFSIAGTLGLSARLARLLGPLHFVVGFFHVCVVIVAFTFLLIHIIRHWKWIKVHAAEMIALP